MGAVVLGVVATSVGPWRDVLKLVEMPPLNEPPPGTLHVRMSACGMGFPDLLQVEGKYQQKAKPPFVPVIYCAGHVVTVGSGVDPASFKVGDRVVGNAAVDASDHLRGGLAQEALLQAATAKRVPDFMSDAVVLSMHENYWDVHHAVSTCGRVGPGDTLLVLGASGACGMAAVDLGKAFGATVVACASTPAKLDACRAAGADQVLNYGEHPDYDAFLGVLRKADLYGKPTVVFDPVGGRYAEAAFRAMARGGRYVVFGFASGGTDPQSAFPTFPANLLLMKGQQLIGSMGSSRGEKIDEMFQMVQDGRLHPASSVTSGASKPYTVHEFERAFSDVATRKAIGKVIITIDSDAASLNP